MQDYVSRVYGDVRVVLLQFWTGSKDFNDSVDRDGPSSANFISEVSSSISYIPLGHISAPWVILASWALRRCLSLPGKGGQLSIVALRFPVKLCLNNLAI